jgi:DNA-binding NtrC family response regulator
MKARLLLIEDDAATRFGFVRYFAKDGYEILEASDLLTAAEALASQQFDAIVLDLNLPDGNGMDFIAAVRINDQAIPIIVITGAGDVPLAVAAMQKGADNFLTKPVDNAALAQFLSKTLEIGALKRQLSARQRTEKKEEIFFGVNPAMNQVFEYAEMAASGDSPLLITGETGTGKGQLAKWIHRQGHRARGEFVEVNCSGLRGELLAREIFGNARGAFTSADRDRKGLIDIADRGTLFLDEIGDMGIEVQAQFLKVLEEKSYRRLGDVRLYHSDFRLICATNRDIESMVANNAFRQDLMYRINLMVIRIPPLRDRVADLPGLVRFLLGELGAAEDMVTDEVMQLLKGYDWPGNIRELRNVLERAMLLTPRGRFRTELFAPLGYGSEPAKVKGIQTVQAVEMKHIATILEQAGGDIDRAARMLNISRATLYRRLKQMKFEKA